MKRGRASLLKPLHSHHRWKVREGEREIGETLREREGERGRPQKDLEEREEETEME